ncbi:ABC transporter substrate-binding protein [Bogoriella caseilytica]|uniref:Carbohydrate ABC transporter substrate-binding protein (CUT1 family) n=1 Tax=Bogoriella caseilytica TaxID=56055 RepID=A0A3N2B958_9MICO|nr:sugar ABC transporter substrate-binding protein [Bogoriella caseilytica]ROR71806.1 carbohydrate ABC transporter substrate-binding protein (CUT1 family) [Bogoriella caseilytica]
MKRMTYAPALAALTGAALALTACGNGNGDGGDPGDGNDGSNDGASSTTVDFHMWAGGDDEVDALREQVAIAEEETGLEVNMRTAPWGDYFTQLTSRLSSGDVACVTGMNGQRLGDYADAFLPLGEEELATAGIDPDDFTEGALDIMSHEGVLYGLPYDVATMLVYYNKDMLDEAGVPEPEAGWSFEDFESAIAGATTDAHRGFGVGMGEFQWMTLPIARSGVQPVTEDLELNLTDPAFVEASEWYFGLVDQGYADVPASASDTGWGEQEYQNGNVALAVDGTWNAVQYLGNDAGFRAGMVEVPRQDGERLGLVLGSGYGVSADCEDPESALQLLGALVGEGAQDHIASSGRSYPARSSSQPLYFEALDEDIRDEVQDAFEVAFSDLEGQLSTNDWTQVNEALQPNLVSVYSGRMTTEELFDQVQQRFGE